MDVTRRKEVSGVLVIAAVCLLAGCSDESDDESGGGIVITTDESDAGMVDATPDPADGEAGDVAAETAGGDAADGSDDAAGDVEGGDAGDLGETVEATVRLQTPLGSALTGAEVAYRDQTATAGEQGAATLSVGPEAPFEFVVTKANYPPHRLMGRAGSEAFDYYTFAASESITSQLFGSVGVEISEDRGILVVGVDTPQLSPVVGARVTVEQSHDQAVTLGQRGADADNKIEEGEQGVVAFPNVPLGEVDISIEPPADETCEVYPGGPPRPTIDVEAGAVNVVTFTCE